MAELLEIVIENVMRSHVCQLLTSLLKQAGKVLEVRCSEAIQLSSATDISTDDIASFISLSEDATLYIKLESLCIDGTNIPSVLLRLVKYNSHFDIDFNFDEDDIVSEETTVLMKKLQVYASKLVAGHEVGNWFGGIEPASDENARYFTRGSLGPLV
ncbi:hypothetical protein [Pseudoalteromonas sp. PPB1]|uniref:hypothetical protein n=1 Tax=Pseudoalteromonas sp. PPB1 TaxID=2756136 RepID=UPI0018919123|nr:hypothetical protein [Pseudoalteromonas sp. PPB1]